MDTIRFSLIRACFSVNASSVILAVIVITLPGICLAVGALNGFSLAVARQVSL